MANGCVFVLSFDGLAISPLGPYGSSWSSTPTLDRIAAKGAVYDRCIVTSDSPLQVLTDLWNASAVPENPERMTWLAAACEQGRRLTLVTDSDAMVDLPAAKPFASRILINPFSGQEPCLERPCAEIEETHLANLFAAALNSLETASEVESSLIWIHSDFLTRLWDAPCERLSLKELDPLEPQETVVDGELDRNDSCHDDSLSETLTKIALKTDPPSFLFARDHDPDVTLAWMNKYAAQVRLLDLLLAVLMEGRLHGKNSRIAILGTSGFALGEHGAIGHGIGPLRNPRIQIPLIVCGDGIPAIRSPTICTPDSLGSLLLCRNPLEGDSGELGSHLCPSVWSASANLDLPPIVTRTSDPFQVKPDSLSKEGVDSIHHAVGRTTPKWFQVRDADGTDHLFAKPDDRFDRNDVVSLLPDVVEEIIAKSP